MDDLKHSCANCFTPEAIERANAHVAHLQANLDITNADHIALWLEEHLSDETGLGWLACRIVEAHERSANEAVTRITSLQQENERLREAAQPQSSAEFHQRRGMLADVILAALHEYDEWMKDDDYNAQGCLERVVKQLERGREVARIAALKGNQP